MAPYSINLMISHSTLAREIFRFESNSNGPLVFITGGMHGNEVAGLKALNRIKSAIEQENSDFHGTFIGLRGNIKAIQNGFRFLETDLNRLWTSESINQIRSKSNLNPEEEELIGLLSFIEQEIEVQGKPLDQVYFLDLHTTSANNGIFSIVPREIKENPIPSALHAPVILGLADKLQGTAIKYFAEMGLISFAFEAGYHESSF